MRPLIAASIVGLLLGCTAPRSIDVSASPPTRLPQLTGHPELISSSDIYAIISEVRRRLGPWTRVYRISVGTRDSVGAYNGSPDTYDNSSSSFIYVALVERQHGEWRLVDNHIAGGVFVD